MAAGRVREGVFLPRLLLTAITDVLRTSRAARVIAIVFQAVASGLIHACQGPAQAITSGVGGTVYGAAFSMAGRNLWPFILARGLNNRLGFVLLYLGGINRQTQQCLDEFND